ncbi:hypothetical protein HOD38_03745 [archaeon]|jgi:hypothetical protein|nr:hypothetical protein [archaeon]MBT4397354.1 hypothetical protein [archaeon]MBT4440734.1 hypothetical protein [archaeon]
MTDKFRDRLYSGVKSVVNRRVIDPSLDVAFGAYEAYERRRVRNELERRWDDLSDGFPIGDLGRDLTMVIALLHRARDFQAISNEEANVRYAELVSRYGAEGEGIIVFM